MRNRRSVFLVLAALALAVSGCDDGVNVSMGASVKFWIAKAIADVGIFLALIAALALCFGLVLLWSWLSEKKDAFFAKRKGR